MNATYKKLPNARMDVIDGEAVLLREDALEVFALSESGAVLWDALDHFDQLEDLASLLCEARADLQLDDARQLVRTFLDSLVGHKLATTDRQFKVRKKAGIVVEAVGDELMVLSRDDRKVHLMNDAAALLWEALDHFSTAAELEDLLGEAWPTKSRAEVQTVVREFLSSLVNLGLVTEIA